MYAHMASYRQNCCIKSLYTPIDLEANDWLEKFAFILWSSHRNLTLVHRSFSPQRECFFAIDGPSPLPLKFALSFLEYDGDSFLFALNTTLRPAFSSCILHWKIQISIQRHEEKITEISLRSHKLILEICCSSRHLNCWQILLDFCDNITIVVSPSKIHQIQHYSDQLLLLERTGDLPEVVLTPDTLLIALSGFLILFIRISTMFRLLTCSIDNKFSSRSFWLTILNIKIFHLSCRIHDQLFYKRPSFRLQ